MQVNGKTLINNLNGNTSRGFSSSCYFRHVCLFSVTLTRMMFFLHKCIDLKNAIPVCNPINKTFKLYLKLRIVYIVFFFQNGSGNLDVIRITNIMQTVPCLFCLHHFPDLRLLRIKAVVLRPTVLHMGPDKVAGQSGICPGRECIRGAKTSLEKSEIRRW